MSHPCSVLSPTSSLPRLRNATPEDVTKNKIAAALRNLTDIYCPLPRTAAFRKPSLSASRCDLIAVALSTTNATVSGTLTPLPVDSGYVSGEEEDDHHAPAATEPQYIEDLRADDYERQFAIRWLTNFIARAEELLVEVQDDVRQRLIDDASYILASFSSATDAEQEDDGGAIVRDFRFSVVGQEQDDVLVQLTDGTPATGSDHTDVGLQSWGASIVVSDIMCSNPEKFDLSAQNLGQMPRIVELGAGTGLVGITMAKLLPRIGVRDPVIVVTDYHPAVLDNLRENVSANFPDAAGDPPVQTCMLDWAAPCLDAPLHEPADMLVATDVVYAPEHAMWLRDCAAKMLASDGVFWLVASVRPVGRFEGVTDTVEGAFAECGVCPGANDGRALRILSKEVVDKRKGIGRGDEIGYKVFRIGWQRVESVL